MSGFPMTDKPVEERRQTTVPSYRAENGTEADENFSDQAKDGEESHQDTDLLCSK